MDAQLQSRVTQVIKINRQITKINDKINLSYRHFKALKTLQATLNNNIQFQFESYSIKNDVDLNAKSNLHNI